MTREFRLMSICKATQNCSKLLERTPAAITPDRIKGQYCVCASSIAPATILTSVRFVAFTAFAAIWPEAVSSPPMPMTSGCEVSSSLTSVVPELMLPASFTSMTLMSGRNEFISALKPANTSTIAGTLSEKTWPRTVPFLPAKCGTSVWATSAPWSDRLKPT